MEVSGHPGDRALDNCRARGCLGSRTCLGTMEKGRKNLLPLMGIEAQFLDPESGGMLPYQLSSCSVVRYGHGNNGFTHVHLRAQGVNVGP
jgi:hypothetical protein